MRLAPHEFNQVLAILDQIDEGRIQPRLPGHIGRFLRQYASARTKLAELLSASNAQLRADQALSGRAFGMIELQALLEPEVRIMDYPLGEVAETLAVSEQLGSLLHLVMWLKGPVANATYNLLLENQKESIRLVGDYRWTPPAKLTPGEAMLDAGQLSVSWQNARCLKAVADDLLRPPHALEYVRDHRLGPHGLKYFRSICAAKRSSGWEVLPAFGNSQPLETLGTLPQPARRLRSGDLAALQIYREPWSTTWTVVDCVAIAPEQALAHSITWADFQRELESSKIDAAAIRSIRETLSRVGVRSNEFGEPDLQHRLHSVGRQVLCWLRGLS